MINVDELFDYTSYTIRRGKSPKRVNRCVSGARLKPVGCG